MSRVQLALNVADIDSAVSFYSKLFGTEPNKRRPGYANFAVDQPPLKLVLIENPGATDSLNHLGVEVMSGDEISSERSRLEEVGLLAAVEESVECCYAVQDKLWVGAPDGEPWEIYTVLSDVAASEDLGAEAGGSVCCSEPVTLKAAKSGCW